ncbi:hypothetical protein PCE1_000376 [Barthelona sp. PCE]
MSFFASQQSPDSLDESVKRLSDKVSTLLKIFQNGFFIDTFGDVFDNIPPRRKLKSVDEAAQDQEVPLKDARFQKLLEIGDLDIDDFFIRLCEIMGANTSNFDTVQDELFTFLEIVEAELISYLNRFYSSDLKNSDLLDVLHPLGQALSTTEQDFSEILIYLTKMQAASEEELRQHRNATRAKNIEKVMSVLQFPSTELQQSISYSIDNAMYTEAISLLKTYPKLPIEYNGMHIFAGYYEEKTILALKLLDELVAHINRHLQSLLSDNGPVDGVDSCVKHLQSASTLCGRAISVNNFSSNFDCLEGEWSLKGLAAAMDFMSSKLNLSCTNIKTKIFINVYQASFSENLSFNTVSDVHTSISSVLSHLEAVQTTLSISIVPGFQQKRNDFIQKRWSTFFESVSENFVLNKRNAARFMSNEEINQLIVFSPFVRLTEICSEYGLVESQSRTRRGTLMLHQILQTAVETAHALFFEKKIIEMGYLKKINTALLCTCVNSIIVAKRGCALAFPNDIDLKSLMDEKIEMFITKLEGLLPQLITKLVHKNKFSANFVITQLTTYCSSLSLLPSSHQIFLLSRVIPVLQNY